MILRMTCPLTESRILILRNNPEHKTVCAREIRFTGAFFLQNRSAGRLTALSDGIIRIA